MTKDKMMMADRYLDMKMIYVSQVRHKMTQKVELKEDKKSLQSNSKSVCERFIR